VDDKNYIFKPSCIKNSMNTRFLVILFLIVISGIYYYNLTGNVVIEESVIIVRVIDGDTLETFDGDKIRLLGINTPEKSMDYYEEARDFLEELVLNRSVVLGRAGRDRYGRTLGYVFLDGENVNSLILREGLGTLYYYEEDDYYKKLRDSEEFARVDELSIWERSENYGCLELLELKYYEDGKRCTNSEVLRIRNSCDKKLDVVMKDDATHIYEETIEANSEFVKNFSCIFNDDGDSLYVWDGDGLLLFERYD